MKVSRRDYLLWIPVLPVVAAVLNCLVVDDWSLLTADQRAHRLFTAGDYEAAATAFADPMWQGAALFRQGEFERAAGVFAGFDTAEGAFNQGNALVMQGQYTAAAARYERALELRPDWEPAVVNRDIALARAALLAPKGGEGVGKLGADKIEFSDKKSPPEAGSEQTEGGGELSDEELRQVWLRQVQTKPADFLRVKFAYQNARRSADAGGTE